MDKHQLGQSWGDDFQNEQEQEKSVPLISYQELRLLKMKTKKEKKKQDKDNQSERKSERSSNSVANKKSSNHPNPQQPPKQKKSAVQNSKRPRTPPKELSDKKASKSEFDFSDYD